jgi:glycosyltransferase involved in cell wall biosynthesis
MPRGFEALMHIGFVALDYPSDKGGGGVGTMVQTVAQGLVKGGHSVAVVALRLIGEPATENDSGVRVVRFGQGCIHWYVSKIPLLGPWLTLTVREIERAWRGWRLIRQLHREEPFDVIEVTEEAGLFITLFMRRVSIVSRLHGEQYTFVKYTPNLPLTLGLRLSRIVQRMALRRTRLLLSPSKAHAQEIIAELGSDRPPIKIIPNTVALPKSSYQTLAEGEEDWTASDAQKVADSGLPMTKGPIVLFVGRLERRKGVSVLLESARLVLAEIRTVHFFLAGGHQPTLAVEYLERLVHHCSLNGHVHFLGHVPREQLCGWYRKATLCVLPSYYETFGIAALEPMAFGVPVIATCTGALSEVVEDGVTGILVAPGDPVALASAIIRLLKQGDLREAMGQEGRRRVQRFFDVDHVLNSNLVLYQRFLKRH